MPIRTTLLIALIATGTYVNGQAINGNHVFRYFGSCESSPCPSATQECCQFTTEKDVTGKFCMTEEQKLDPDTKKLTYFGTYEDNEFTIWDWKCKYDPGEYARRQREKATGTMTGG